MCIAILKTKDGIITDEQLRESFRRNSDGSGIAYTINNKLVIEKGIFDENQFVDAVRKAEVICDNNMIIHCRISTSGHKDYNNCHPHLIREDVCVAHNGIISRLNGKETDNSDTVMYARDVLAKISTDDLVHNEAIKELISRDIGSYNKFVLLDNLGEYTILNEAAGHWNNGVWYSNDSYKPAKVYSYYDNPKTTFSSKSNIIKTPSKIISLLSKQDTSSITAMINNLSDKEIIKLGENPHVSVASNGTVTPKLVHADDATSYDDALLDLDADLFEYFIEKYDLVINNAQKECIDSLGLREIVEDFFYINEQPLLFVYATTGETWLSSESTIELLADTNKVTYRELDLDTAFKGRLHDILHNTLSEEDTKLLENLVSVALEDIEVEDLEWFRTNSVALDVLSMGIEPLDYYEIPRFQATMIPLKDISSKAQTMFENKAKELGITYNEAGYIVRSISDIA